MRTIVSEYAIAFFVFLAIDAVWLTLMGRAFYGAEIGALLRERPNFAVAFLFYLLFVAGLLVFVIHPLAPEGPSGQVLIKGAFFGLVAYATYDLTNLATMKGFTVRVAVVDMIWGAVLAGAVSYITVALVHWLKISR